MLPFNKILCLGVPSEDFLKWIRPSLRVHFAFSIHLLIKFLPSIDIECDIFFFFFEKDIKHNNQNYFIRKSMDTTFVTYCHNFEMCDYKW